MCLINLDGELTEHDFQACVLLSGITRNSHCARESPGEEDGIERRWHTLKPFIAS